jgi:hypothetical protein
VAGNARRGRRDNGLVAAVYAVAGDVDPRIGEHMLDVLSLRGIAAYLQPSVDLHPVTRSAMLPARPIDRLFVDRDHLDLARGFLTQLGAATPGPTPSSPARDRDLEKAFADIVAGYNATADSAGRPWPDQEDLPPQACRDEPAAPLARWQASTIVPEDSLLTGLDSFGSELPDDEDEDFTPPPPPPLPRLAPMTILSLLAIAVGLVIFFRPELLSIDDTTAMVIGCTAVVAGTIGLIWRLRPGDDDDEDDQDDGAVV